MWGTTVGFPRERYEARVTPVPVGVRQDLGLPKGAVRLQWPYGMQSRILGCPRGAVRLW